MKHIMIVKKSMVVLFLMSISLLSACFMQPVEHEDLGYKEIPEILIKPGMENHPGNQYQSADTFMTVVDGKLYIMNDLDEISAFEQGELKTVFDPPTDYIRIAFCGNLAYYVESIEGPDSIQCYDITSGRVYCITDDDGGTHLYPSFMNDNCWYFRTFDSDDYYILNGMQWTGPCSVSVKCSFGKNLYCGTDNIIYRNLGGNVSIVKELSERSGVTPYKDGLIVEETVEGEEINKMLVSYITPNGECVELIQTECRYAWTSLNYYKDTVYFSFLRIGQEGFKGPTTYDDDTQSGTYKIDMNTFEAQKISDTYYQSMYIFDDTGIYAEERLNDIYKLDFDGNVVTPILVRNRPDSSPMSWQDLLRDLLGLSE